MRVVLTRPQGRGEEFAERLRADGHEVVHVPLTRVEDGDPFPDPAPFDGVLFTSVSAVERAPDGVRWPRVGAVGQTTANALAARGIDVAVVGNGGGGELARAWGPATGQRLLLPTAERAHPALADGLRAAGAEVVTVAVYRTLPVSDPDTFVFESADVVCFFAPSAVRAFEALDVKTGASFWALGKTTEEAMANLSPKISDLR
ncbi:MAG: uroporphyrinogen-III synthase [Planctomycetota bacterium]|jgi:uroporphyrinogen-III synthase